MIIFAKIYIDLEYKESVDINNEEIAKHFEIAINNAADIFAITHSINIKTNTHIVSSRNKS